MRTNRFILLFITALISCTNRYESVFDESANERVREAIAGYKTELVDAPSGWRAVIEPRAGGAYMFFFEFETDGTVTMISDFNDETANTPMAGTYSMKALQRPTLSFDTYSYIHLLADPDATVNGGEFGLGLESDFEFAFERTENDSVILEGLQNKTRLALVRATAQERTAFLNGAVSDSRTNAASSFSENAYTYFPTASNGPATLGINPSSKMFTIFYLDNSLQIQKKTTAFTYSDVGIKLNTTISAAGLTFNELLWDDDASSFYLPNGNAKVVLQNSASPIIFDNAIPSLSDALGFEYDSITIGSSIASLQSQVFLDLYEETSENLTDTFGISLGTVAITFTNNRTVVNYQLLSGSTQVYVAELTYPRNITSGGVITISSRISANVNTLAINTMAPLINYFEGNTFTAEYVPNANIGDLLAWLRPQASPDDYFYGGLK